MSTPGGPLDPRSDPDRYDPSREGEPAPSAGPLDPRSDPDRYDPGRSRPRTDPTLPDLFEDSVGDEPRDTYTWFLGLLGVLAFLGLVALLFGRVLSAG